MKMPISKVISDGMTSMNLKEAQPRVTAPIAGATSLEQLHDLHEAATLELDRAALEVLNRASAH